MTLNWRQKIKQRQAIDAVERIKEEPKGYTKRLRFGGFGHLSEDDNELRKALRVDGMAKRRHTPSMPKLPWEETT